MPRRPRIVLADPELTGVPSGEDHVKETLSHLSHRARRFAQRKFLKMRTTTRQRAITMDDVPPGSVLSDATIAAIQAGKYALAVDVPKPTAPVRSKKPIQRARHKMAKASRKQNRKKR